MKKKTSSREDFRAKQPDVEELRQRRYAYFGSPVADRRKTVTPVSSKSKSREKVVTVEYKRKKKSSSSSGGSSRKSSRSHKRRERDRSDDYVYEDAPARSERRTRDKTPPPIRSRSPSVHSTLSNQDNLPSIIEQEVTPDDSISQIAMNPRPRPRTSTKRHTLPPISEQQKPSPPSPSRSKPQSRNSLLDSLFRRKSTHAPAQKLVECLTCGSDDVPSSRTAKLACGHIMCHDCLKRLFRMAVNDPAHMPPRCCTSQHIPLSHVDNLFDMHFKLKFNKKFDEYHTKNRIYCPAPRCGTWIRPSHFSTSSTGRKSATCPRCRTKVCTLCSARAHKSADCPSDPEIARLVAQGVEEGWQRCYNCKAMVELREGCNHMTCRCMAEFCMVCGAKWKSCECPWFNYRDLPDPDRLGGMRVPEPVQVVYRRVFDAAAPPRRRDEEVDARRRQERLDEDLARRMQLQDLGLPPNRRAPRVGEETIGLGNAAGHHLNEDFRRAGAGPGPGSMRGFGDEAMGRRGERSSGRRREVRRSAPPMAGGGGGLVGDFLGSPSVLGFGGSRRMPVRY